jgi:hypothetical protein
MRLGPKSKPKRVRWSSSMDALPHSQFLPQIDQNSLGQIAAATAAARHVLSIWDGDRLQTVRISIEDLRAALSQITEGRALLEHVLRDPTPALAHAVSEYRAALAELKPHLPRLEGWLLAERGRLVMRRSHAVSVTNWTEANGKTR